MMKERTAFLIPGILAIVICLISIKPAYAILVKLTPEQVEEAITYGKKNMRMNVAEFSSAWTVPPDEGKGAATLFTSYLNIAYKARKYAVEHREFSSEDVLQAMQIGNSLTFTVTVYGEGYDFARQYFGKLYCGNETIWPVYEFIPEVAEASEYWPDPPSNLARLVFKFPLKNIELNSKVKLVVVESGGDEINFSFDLSKMK